MLEGATFLVTGATGRIGSELSHRLEELGASVLPLVLGGYPDVPRRIPWTARAKPIRIRSRDDLQKLSRPDYVISCHWEVDRELNPARQLAFEVDHNICSLDFLWEWVSREEPRGFAGISTIKIYSSLNRGPISSETEPRPLTPYGVAKLAAEKFLDAHFDKARVPTVHIRLPSVMSVGGHPSQLVSQLLESVLHGKRIRINAGHLAFLVYIEEAVDLIISVVAKACRGRVNIVPPGYPNEKIAEMFAKIARREVLAEYQDLQPAVTDPTFVPDFQGFYADWVRHAPLEEALLKIIQMSA